MKMKKIILGILGSILLIIGIILNRTHSVDSGIAMIIGIFAGLLIGAMFGVKEK